MFALNDARKRNGLENTRPKCPRTICQGIFGTLGTPISNSLARVEKKINNSSVDVKESGTPVPSVPKSVKLSEAEELSVEAEEQAAIKAEGSLNP